MTKLIMRYGVLDEDVAQQLDQQGFSIDEKDAKRFEEYRTSIHSLHFAGIITDGWTSRALENLHKQITLYVKEHYGTLG